MELDTVGIDPGEAAAKLAEYSGLGDAATAEDRAIAAGYRAAAAGRPVISLRSTVTAGGWFDDGLPRIAVARADAAECFCRWDGAELVFADRDDMYVNRGALVGAHSVRVPVGGDDAPVRRRSYWSAAAVTMVPLVPPAHRPRRLRRCHVLWEVEQWAPVPR